MHKIELKIYFIILFFLSFRITAQDDPDFPFDGDPGAPAAPIDNWVLPMLVVGIVLIMLYLKKHKIN